MLVNVTLCGALVSPTAVLGNGIVKGDTATGGTRIPLRAITSAPVERLSATKTEPVSLPGMVGSNVALKLQGALA